MVTLTVARFIVTLLWILLNHCCFGFVSVSSENGCCKHSALSSAPDHKPTSLKTDCHDEHDMPESKSGAIMTRRQSLARTLTTATTAVMVGPTNPASAASTSDALFQTTASSTELPAGLLESRVLENVLSPPPYGMEGPDVFYPSWFSGTWNVVSECTDVLAPCGVDFFGGNRTYQGALADKGPARALRYEARFVPSADNTIIADREFNVKSIAKVAMGKTSVVDVATATPNKFSCLLLPEGAPSMMTVDLLVLNRRQEQIGPETFDCSEVVREIISPVDSSGAANYKRNPILKEVETASLYKFEDSRISCRQRSATFLLPSQQDPMAFQMWQATRGRPIDVRFYNVEYTKRQ